MTGYLYNLATDKHKGFVSAILKLGLFILSCAYGLVIRFLILFNRLRIYKLGAVVISVGNITLGGTGKTVIVEYICRFLRENNRKVSVLSRGYKISHKAIADEPGMLQAKLKDVPVLVDLDRIRSGNLAIINYSADTLVLDDGFQQWRIEKDLDIVVIDATNPFGNNHMIPRGILREPLSSLKRASVFVLTKVNFSSQIESTVDFLRKINPSAEVFESLHKPVGFYSMSKPQELLSPERLKGKTAALLCGIGDPSSFEKIIVSLGVNVGLSFRFPDHYNYTQKDLDEIAKKISNKGIDTIITTEKDTARLRSFQLSAFSFQLLVLRITLAIKDEQGFRNRLLSLYSV